MPVPWAGANQKIHPLDKTPIWAEIAMNDSLVLQALSSLQMTNQDLQSLTLRKRSDLLLLADTRQGGHFLKNFLDDLSKAGGGGLVDRKGRFTGISASGFMWETIATTVERVVGTPVEMEKLTYWTPPKIAEYANDTKLQCADITDFSRVCIFQGTHTYPFLFPTRYQHQSHIANALHKLIWEDWFKSGNVTRQ